MINTTDVLVIGAGGAGCRAALEASYKGAKVAIVCKGEFGKCGTTAFQVADTAGYNVADGIVDGNDSPEQHFLDIIDAGLGMAYPELAKTLAAEALATVPFLEQRGVEFEKDPATGRYIEVVGCFASKARMHILKGHGEPIMRALTAEIRQAPIDIFENLIVTKLLLTDGTISGAIAFDREGRITVFRAKAVILATGGASQLFKYRLTPSDITGDGYALGIRAGAQLVNMEFMQVVLGTVAPTKNQLNTFLWCAQPRLMNARGEEFLDRYLPAEVKTNTCMAEKSTHFPFSSRDYSKYIEIAVQTEIREGRGTPAGGVYLDLTAVTDEKVSRLPADSPLPKVWPLVREFLKKRQVDIAIRPVEVGCFAHAINGGLKIDEFARTTIPGLYAAGEVAGGPHGADRLGGNMLLTCQVFGAKAGQHSADFARQKDFAPLSPTEIESESERLMKLKGRQGAFTPQLLKQELQEVMSKGALVVRTDESLGWALEQLQRIGHSRQNVQTDGNQAVVELLELDNLLTVGEAIIKAARQRRESRGSHYRADYPVIDPKWNKRIFIRYGGDGVETLVDSEG